MHGTEASIVDRSRKSGVSNQVKGAVKEVVGELTGDGRTARSGRAEQKLGRAQQSVADARDEVRRTKR